MCRSGGYPHAPLAPGKAVRVGRSNVMGILWIVCPVTGRKVSTGIETDKDSFDQIPATPMKCPDCGEQHAWKAMQPKLVEEAQTPSGRR